ncbi:MAG: UMP kinase [Clostridia bacterium]|nr:UMP kinase [Clostridia bacterium]
MAATYKRVLIKLSGEALAGEKGFGIDHEVLNRVAGEIVSVAKTGIQIALVIGAGNFWRGRQGSDMNRATADHMGMLATALNALAMQDAFDRLGYPSIVQSALTLGSVAEPFHLRRAISALSEGKIIIFSCGTGSPFFTTDTGAALRAAEIEADALLLAKNVDGIYDSDPKKNPNAKKYDKISYMDIIEKGLKAIDLSAAAMCMENKIPVIAFALFEKESIKKAVSGEPIGTIIE